MNNFAGPQIGLDIIEISRFERGLGENFIAHCFTENERAYIQHKGPRTTAGLFAAKEAVVKALGTGFQSRRRFFWPCEVEICHDENGAPYAVLHGEALKIAENMQVSRITLSITHDRSVAAAVALAERTEQADACRSAQSENLAEALTTERTGKAHARRYRRTNARNRRLRHS